MREEDTVLDGMTQYCMTQYQYCDDVTILVPYVALNKHSLYSLPQVLKMKHLIFNRNIDTVKKEKKITV